MVSFISHSFAPRLSVTLILLALLCASPSSAEDLVKLSPEMRLSRGSADQGESSENVDLFQVKAEELPPSIAEEVKASTLICFGSQAAISSIRIYGWRSDKNKKQGLRPNLIVDYTGLAPLTAQQKCTAHPLCDSQGCVIKGYAATAQGPGWVQDFELRATRLIFTTSTQSQKKRTGINTLSNIKDCVKTNGKETDGGCLKRYEWRTFGLSQLSPN